MTGALADDFPFAVEGLDDLDLGRAAATVLQGQPLGGVDILVAGPVPSPCTFYFTSDRKISRRCIVEWRIDDQVFLRFA